MRQHRARKGASAVQSWPNVCARCLCIDGFVAIAFDPSQAQVFEVTGGSSALFDATGGAIAIHGTNSEMSAGFGSVAGKMRFGGVIKTELGGYNVSLGDNYIPFR